MHAPYLPRSRRALEPTPLRRGAGIIFVLLLICALSGCSDDASPQDEAECSVDNPCPDTQSCLQGVCVARQVRECSTRSDCPSGDYECIDQVCALPTPDAGPAPDNNPNPNPDATGNNPTDPDTTQPEGPRVVSTTPADGAEGVAWDTDITIEFNEAMDPTSMNFYSLLIRDANNFALNLDREGAIQYDADTFRTRLTLDTPLDPAEGYKVEIRSGARNAAGVGLNPPVTVHFSTRYEEPAKHFELARTWAPLLYQGIDLAEGLTPNENGDNISNPTRPDADIPTRIDFDSNLMASDNLQSSKQAATPIEASIYYSVIESPQFYFLQYILYYPSRYSDATRAEHDFAALVVVLDKATETMLMSESVSLGTSSEVTLGYKPDTSSVSVPGGNAFGRSIEAFPPSELEDGTRFPLYVLAGTHQACHWYKSGRDGHCLHSSAQFPGNSTGAAPDDTMPTSGVLLRPGDTGQTFGQATHNADSGFWEMTYALQPIPTGIWARRGNYDADGLFDVSSPYRPQGSDRPTGMPPEQSLMLPQNLRSDAATSYGRTPFSWLKSPGERNRGQWLLDPVYILGNRYILGSDVTGDYCHNFYLKIDHLGSDAHPDCAH